MVYMTNRFRQKELGLEPIRTGNHGGTIVAQLKVHGPTAPLGDRLNSLRLACAAAHTTACGDYTKSLCAWQSAAIYVRWPLAYSNNHILLPAPANKVPFMYCFSPSVLPKPSDWGPHIDVVGYFFLEEATLSDYRPPQELEAFLEAGLPPV